MDTTSSTTAEATPDLSALTYDQVEAYRVAAIAEIAARGEKAAFMKQGEAFVSTAFNRGYSREEISAAFAETMVKVYGPEEPPAEEPTV
jgi:hypothetical protein